MKKTITTIILLISSSIVFSQNSIQASIKKGASPNAVDIAYLPNYNSDSGEYVNYLSISIAIADTASSGVNPTIAGVGNFSSLSFTQAVPFSYVRASEKVYTWTCTNTSPLAMSWANGIAFTGVTITFSGHGPGAAQVKMLDLSQVGGGDNASTYFAIGVNVPPSNVTNSGNIFYSIINGNNTSRAGVDGNGDQFVTTNAAINMN